MFMTLGPVASLSAQVNRNSVEWISSDVNAVEENTEVSVEENAQPLAQTDMQHNCCEESKCHCSYQNECDIQNLTFFALSKLQPQILASIEHASVITTYQPIFHKSESSSIYRPPIV